MNILEALVEKGRAGYAALYLVSGEDQRAMGEIKRAAEVLKRKLYYWIDARGLQEDGKPEGTYVTETDSQYNVVSSLIATDGQGNNRKPRIPNNSIVVLRGFHHHIKDPVIQASLFEALPKYKLTSRMVIVLSSVLTLPPELEKEFALVEMGLPNEEILNTVLQGIIDHTDLKTDEKPDDERRKELVDAAKGLTTQEAENALALSMVRPKMAKKKGKDLWDPSIVLSEKCLALRKNGLLEYIPLDESRGLQSVGGLDHLKEYVAPLQRAFTKEALDFGLSYPKGLLVVGVPGTGKSLCAKAISVALRHPLLKLDMGKIYQSLVGSSEANIRNAIQVAEAIAPCVLWMDEIEKGLAGASAGALDSGVSARVLGTILTWMQEKTSPVYVYATANNVGMLPPEVLRKGRFDEIFSVDLPTARERKEILRIHLERRRRGHLTGSLSENKIDLDHFAGETTEGFTGAEIEGCLEQALRVCFHNHRDLNLMDLQAVFDDTQPLSRIMQRQIQEMRDWCAAHTRPANRKITEVPGAPTQVGASGRHVGMA